MNIDHTFHVGPYIVPLLVVALVAWRLIRNKPQKVKHGRLFVMPALLAAAAAFTLSETPFPGVFWIIAYIAAGAAGTGAGYLSGHHREFTLDPETNDIMSRATPIGTIIFGALFAARFGLKLLFPQLSGGSPYGPPGSNLHPAANVIGWTDAGLVFSSALILSTAITTWLRTRHLVAERSARNSSPPPSQASTLPK
jgi:mannose/fructose/N-acetylgalactosamine-specific phosphotransferase system component IID